MSSTHTRRFRQNLESYLDIPLALKLDCSVLHFNFESVFSFVGILTKKCRALSHVPCPLALPQVSSAISTHQSAPCITTESQRHPINTQDPDV